MILKTPVEGLACEVSSERGSIQKFESIRKYRTLLEAIQKSAELASKMLRQQHFLYQRKNLYIPILGRIFSSESDSEDTSRESALPPEFFAVPVHRTLFEKVW